MSKHVINLVLHVILELMGCWNKRRHSGLQSGEPFMLEITRIMWRDDESLQHFMYLNI